MLLFSEIPGKQAKSLIAIGEDGRVVKECAQPPAEFELVSDFICQGPSILRAH